MILLIPNANVMNGYEILFSLIVCESGGFSSLPNFLFKCLFDRRLKTQLTADLILNFSRHFVFVLFYRNTINTVYQNFLFLFSAMTIICTQRTILCEECNIVHSNDDYFEFFNAFDEVFIL